jgi:hypothetical protein
MADQSNKRRRTAIAVPAAPDPEPAPDPAFAPAPAPAADPAPVPADVAPEMPEAAPTAAESGAKARYEVITLPAGGSKRRRLGAKSWQYLCKHDKQKQQCRECRPDHGKQRNRSVNQ